MSDLRLGQHLQQSLGQHMLLLPRMLQSIEVLQLPTAELEGWLQQAAQENEALTLEERRPRADRRREGRGTREDSARRDEWLQNQPDRGPGPAERLEAELALLDLEPLIARWVGFLIGCLDERGFLPDEGTLLALARGEGLFADAGLLRRATEVLQSLEPRGIGARNAIEALVLQLDPEDPEYANLRALLEDFLEDVAKNRLPAVARAMGISIEELRALIGRLRELDPRPGASLSDEAAPCVWPDVVVEAAGEGFEVRVESSALPPVSIDPTVAALSRDKSQPGEVRSYLRDKLDRARWVIEALEQRGATVARVAAALFEHQRPFLEHGPGHLLPLRMRELAHGLGLHVSTISRAVAHKYAQTPWGIFPLRHFFQAPAGADRDSARGDVREAVREILTEEDPSRPLSDDEVVERMATRGWSLARRTVAKYRGELGIPSSYRRRVYR